MIAKSESLPKKIKSLFIHHGEDDEDTYGKRSSCHSSDSSSKKFSPTTWFSHIRNRSTSSSITFSSSPSYQNYMTMENDSYYRTSSSLFEALSTELNGLFSNAKEELFYALESQGSIYYEGDKSTAEAAFKLFETRYTEILNVFEGTTNSIKFKFQWKTDVYQLRARLLDLPQVQESIYD